MTPTSPGSTGAPRLRLADPDADARQREADRPRPALAVIGVRRDHVRFGHAVALEDGVAGPLPPRRVRLGEQRRRAGNEEPHVRRGLAGQARMVEEPRVEGRHAHQRRRRGHGGDDRVGVEPALVDHRRPGEQRDVDRDEEPVGVEHRQRVDEAVGRREAPDVDQRQRVRRRFSWVSIAPFERPVVPEV